MAISYTPEMQAAYQRLFDTCVITPDKYVFVDGAVKLILNGRSRYEALGTKLGIPWYFIGLAHQMECANNFEKHLHNGDPLKAKTVNVPANRPPGSPPWTWEFSAEDALTVTGITKWKDWSLPGVLYKLEGYNGYGYRRQGINSPYLWSFSNHYTKGKYIADGVYSATAVSKQCGIAVILRRLAEKQIVSFGITDRKAQLKQIGDLVVYAPAKYSAKAEELQNLLNLNGAHLKADGKAGKFTSDAYQLLTGELLNGDPRKV